MSMTLTKRSAPVVAGLVAAQLVAGPVTIRDINRRSKDQVRGPRLLWKLWAGTNLAGVAAYWLLGRK